MKNPEHVIAFDASAVTPQHTVIDDPSVVDTPYKSCSWHRFENAGKGAMAGIWEAEPHKERCKCDFDEMCHILEGDVRLTDRHGQTRTFGAGDSFVVAAGFDGTWENLTAVRKVFFILS